MKQLTCEMCGSTDLLKQDGVFVCLTCGTKYSIEEAKKMMIEGTVDVSGSTVKVDNTESINSYMSIAENAYNANNTAEAEVYCNKIIEIDPQNYNAWMLKGKSAGWQSSLANIRLGEAINCFLNAIQFAPEEPQPVTLNLNGLEVKATLDVRSKLIDEAAEEIKSIGIAIVKLQGDRFEKWPDSDEYLALIKLTGKIGELVWGYVSATQKVLDLISDMLAVATNSAMNAYYNVIRKEYTEEKFPDKQQLITYLNRTDYVIKMINFAIKQEKNDYEANIKRYQFLININNDIIPAKSYDSKYLNYDRYHNGAWAVKNMEDAVRRNGDIPDSEHSRYWFVDSSLNDSAKATRKAEITNYLRKIEECKELAAQKKREEAEKKAREQRERNEAYWEEHADKKKELESERDSLQEKLKQLEEQVAPYDTGISTWKNKREADTPAKEEKKTVEKQISMLKNEQNSLGIFKGKEKKALQAQIDELNSRLPTINESIEAEEKEQAKMCNSKIRELEQQAAPIKEELEKAKARINEINTELTKDR